MILVLYFRFFSQNRRGRGLFFEGVSKYFEKVEMMWSNFEKRATRRTDQASRTVACTRLKIHLFAFGAFRGDVSGVAFVAVLFERIFGVVYEPLWPGDAIRANGASEAICVKLHILHETDTLIIACVWTGQ